MNLKIRDMMRQGKRCKHLFRLFSVCVLNANVDAIQGDEYYKQF